MLIKIFFWRAPRAFTSPRKLVRIIARSPLFESRRGMPPWSGLQMLLAALLGGSLALPPQMEQVLRARSSQQVLGLTGITIDRSSIKRAHRALAAACRQHRCEKEATVLSTAAVQAGQAGTPILHGTHTSCAHLVHTVCATRASGM